MEIRDRLPREGPFRNPGESARDDNLPGKGKMLEEEEEVERGWEAVSFDDLTGTSMTSVLRCTFNIFRISKSLHFTIVGAIQSFFQHYLLKKHQRRREREKI